MRHLALLLPIFLATACSLEQKDGEWTSKPAPLFADQRWETERVTGHDGSSLCTVSAGELEVVVGPAGPRVGVSRKFTPGVTYAVLVGEHKYTLQGGTFNAAQSRAIVNDFLASDVVYTEWQEPTRTGHGSQWHRSTNKIRLEGFAPAYKECQAHVGPVKKAKKRK